MSEQQAVPDLSTAEKQKNGRPLLPISIREADQSDVSFIFSSWLKSFQLGAMTRFVERTIYFNEQHKLIERLLQSSTVLVACDPDDPGQIYGYLCYEQIEGIMCVHYTYTKQPFRALGVAKQLLEKSGYDWQNSSGVYTHHTRLGGNLSSYKYNLVYHPYILINRPK